MQLISESKAQPQPLTKGMYSSFHPEIQLNSQGMDWVVSQKGQWYQEQTLTAVYMKGIRDGHREDGLCNSQTSMDKPRKGFQQYRGQHTLKETSANWA